MGTVSAGRYPKRWAWVALCAAFALGMISPSASARIATEVALLSGLGYSSVSEGPSILVGTEVRAYSRQGGFLTGLQEASIGVHISDALTIDPMTHTVTFGVEGGWERSQGPTVLALQGQAYFRQRDGGWSRTLGVFGTGSFGRIQGRFGVDYIESGEAAFPWFQRDLDGLIQEGPTAPTYRAQAGVSAVVLPSYGLRWSQDVRWLKPADSSGSLSVSTGPEIAFGPGFIVAQAGVQFDEEGIEPLFQVRYQFLFSQSPVEFQLTASTRSLDGQRPVVYGWFGHSGERIDLGAALKVEEAADGTWQPSLYFSFHPKF